MSLVSLLVILVILAVVYWGISTYVPANPIRKLALIVLVVVAVCTLLYAVGIFGRGRLNSTRVPQVGNCSVVHVGL